jgi:ankyrin repeat protein
VSPPTVFVTEFLVAASVPRDRGHGSGTLEEAEAIRARHPEVAAASIHVAAALGDDAAVGRFLAADRGAATAKGGPYQWDPLTHLCFSRYLRLDPSRSEGFVGAATALLDAGADANTSWFERDGERESALYGAAGVAHHPGVTELLLQRGGDPNDGETPYHSPETHDNRAVQVLLESGKLTADSLAMMLLRKADWHDRDGVALLLQHGADPNHRMRWGNTPFHNAVLSDNDLAIVELMLDQGGDPLNPATAPDNEFRPSEGRTPMQLAAWRGRGDVLRLLQARGVPLALHGADRLIAACALGDAAAVKSIAESDPAVVAEVRSNGGRLLAQFAGTGNTDGVRLLLDLGIDVAERFKEGDGYFDEAPDSTALHVAAWRANHGTVKLLLARGVPVNARDGKGRTPLALAVRACIDSYWMRRRSPESVAALIAVGASDSSIQIPTGYREIDALLT